MDKQQTAEYILKNKGICDIDCVASHDCPASYWCGVGALRDAQSKVTYMKKWLNRYAKYEHPTVCSPECTLFGSGGCVIAQCPKQRSRQCSVS